MAKRLSVESLLWLALILALVGSLRHLAATFASIDGNVYLGWLQAVAIDVGLFALAYSIRLHKVAGRSVKPVWFGVTVFTGISIYGNYAYAIFATTGNFPGWIILTRPAILAGSLPVLVLFLSELLSNDRQHAVDTAAKKQVTVARRPVTHKPATSKNTKKHKLAVVLKEQPDVSVSEAARVIGVSRQTVRNYMQEMKNENGKGS
jgi:hypothetical protein